eukprot:Em0018g433a
MEAKDSAKATESVSASRATEKAVQLAKMATEADSEQKYEEALPLYQHAIDYFLQALKYESHRKASKHSIKKKCQQYLERAETLDTFLAKAKKGAVHQDIGTSSEGKTINIESGPNSQKSKDHELEEEGGGEEGCDDEEEDDIKLKDQLSGAIVQEKPNVQYENIAGLQAAKEVLKESVILPLKFPHLFTGKRKPCQSILLYGPPGTGKSTLAMAVATEADSTFFSISGSDVVSIWLGESDRFIRNLFELARANKPAIVFIEELDIAFGAHSDSESDATRRIKTEFLVQMQEVGRDNDGLFVLGASNAPWKLNAAIRRRFKKRIYIPLPDEMARRCIFELNIGNTPCKLSSEDLSQLAKMTAGYSGADISNVVQEALMMPINKIKTTTHFKKVQGPRPADPPQTVDDLYTPCGPRDEGAKEMSWMEVPRDRLLQQFVTVRDFMKSLEHNSPTVNESELKQFCEFTEEFGQKG